MALGLALVAALWIFFGERTLRSTMEEGGTKALGTELDVADLKIRLAQSALEVSGIAIADPFDARRNLVEVKQLLVELEPAPLLEKKLVVSRLTISGVRTGTARATPARSVAAGGFAPAALRQMQQWAKQFDVPLLSLTPIDTIKSIVLDPAQLASVKAALALAQRVDSTRAALERSYATLRLQETLDSSRALLTRLQGMNVRTLGIQGARTAVTDVRRTAAQVESARRRVEALATGARTTVDSLEGALRSVDDARKADYAFARRLIKLPSFDAPDIGAALFGKVTIDKVQQALYWTALARQYMPPGLLPKESDGPKRLRASGTTVHFVKPQAYPRFLLRRADLTVDVTDGPARGSYVAAVTNATTEPALVGAPTLFAVRRTATATGIDSLRVTGSLDHVKAKPRDVLTVQAGGVALPTFPIPGLPYRGDPGRGTSELRLTLDGDQLAAHWTLSTRKLAWIADSAAKKLKTIESLVARVLTGVASLQMNADVTGTLQSPKLAVSSNLDRVVADQLKSVAGEQVAAAEAKVRARVDSLVAEKSVPIKARVAEIRADADDQPWEFYRDYSRQLWDEARHAMMGTVALEARGIDWKTDIPLNVSFALRLNLHATPVERQMMLYAIEQSLMPGETGKRYEYETAVAAGDTLSAHFHDYDWADEVLHAQIGRRMLKREGISSDEARERAKDIHEKTWAALDQYRSLDEQRDWWPGFVRKVLGKESAAATRPDLNIFSE